MMVYFHFSLAQAFRARVKTRVRTRSGSDGILTIRRNLMIRSLPLPVLTRTLYRWAAFNRRLRRLFGRSAITQISLIFFAWMLKQLDAEGSSDVRHLPLV